MTTTQEDNMTTTCTGCNGQGYYYARSGVRRMKCPVCGGTGTEAQAVEEVAETTWMDDQANGFHRGVEDAEEFLASVQYDTAAVGAEWDARRLQVTNPDQAYLLSYVGRLAYALDEECNPAEVAAWHQAREDRRRLERTATWREGLTVIDLPPVAEDVEFYDTLLDSVPNETDDRRVAW